MWYCNSPLGRAWWSLFVKSHTLGLKFYSIYRTITKCDLETVVIFSKKKKKYYIINNHNATIIVREVELYSNWQLQFIVIIYINISLYNTVFFIKRNIMQIWCLAFNLCLALDSGSGISRTVLSNCTIRHNALEWRPWMLIETFL